MEATNLLPHLFVSGGVWSWAAPSERCSQFGGAVICCLGMWGHCPMSPRVFNSVPGLYFLEAPSMLCPVAVTKQVVQRGQMSLRGKLALCWEPLTYSRFEPGK